MSDRVLLTGASGLIGGALSKRWVAAGRPVRRVSRSPGRLASLEGSDSVQWDGRDLPAEALDGVSAVVHLAGEPVFGGLPTRARLDRIWRSRVESTRNLVRRIGERPPGERPHVLVCASAVGYYGDRGDEELREDAAPGSGFLAELCVAWEEEARRAEAHGLRVARVRFAVVLSPDGGALPALTLLFKSGLGGRIGSGRQWFPWVDGEDAVALVERAVDDARVSGALNAVAPGVLRNADFTRALARKLHRPAFVPVPAFAVRLALRDLSSELLDSRRVLPAVAESLAHPFTNPHL
jgi:uncharacterized protein (TIGR01777 family)